MKINLVIRNAKQLITCSSNGKARRGAQMQSVGVIENGALAIDKEKII